MASYTIEDIELLRRKSGISYQEAVSLLDYHNGNVARALIDLEKNGRIRPEPAQPSRAKASTATAASKSSGKGFFTDLLTRLYCARIKVMKDETTIINVSSLFAIACAFFATHMVIVGVVVCLLLGYRFSFTKSDKDFEPETVQRMVRSAADNVRSSVNDFTRGFQSGMNGSAPEGKKSVDIPDIQPAKSYYARPDAAATYRAEVPTLNVPVQVESQDGSVTVQGDSEGYTSATIE